MMNEQTESKLRNLVDLYFKNTFNQPPFNGSIEEYLKTGNPSGSFYMALMDLAIDAHDLTDRDVFNGHNTCQCNNCVHDRILHNSRKS